MNMVLCAGHCHIRSGQLRRSLSLGDGRHGAELGLGTLLGVAAAAPLALGLLPSPLLLVGKEAHHLALVGGALALDREQVSLGDGLRGGGDWSGDEPALETLWRSSS